MFAFLHNKDSFFIFLYIIPILDKLTWFTKIKSYLSMKTNLLPIEYEYDCICMNYIWIYNINIMYSSLSNFHDLDASPARNHAPCCRRSITTAASACRASRATKIEKTTVGMKSTWSQPECWAIFWISGLQWSQLHSRCIKARWTFCIAEVPANEVLAARNVGVAAHVLMVFANGGINKSAWRSEMIWQTNIQWSV